MATFPPNSSSHSVAHSAFFSQCYSPVFKAFHPGPRALWQDVSKGNSQSWHFIEFTPPSYPCRGHSHSPTSFYLICRVTSSAPGHRPTSCSDSFMLEHTEVQQRHFQIPVRSAQFLNLATAISKKNSYTTVYLTVFSITLTIYHCIFL